MSQQPVIYKTLGALVLLLASTQSNAAIDASVATSDDFSATPPLLTRSSVPLVMLGMSVDHELFKRAYSDYTDLDADGQLNTTYTDSFDYYGYFDSDWCYSYGSGEFSPIKAVDGISDGSNHYCSSLSGQRLWSGNFLNWASMSRIDLIRKVLYGGKRSTDIDGKTVLERAYLPEDVHAFGKVYQGSDIGQLTPYTSAVSLCSLSTSTTSAPLMRVASGDWPRWASSESFQCAWDNGLSSPPEATNKLMEAYVRVVRCEASLDAATSDECQTYSNGNHKPVGLLQNYGEQGNIRFGLISGSYDKRDAGGVLRKNIGLIGGNTDPTDDEVDAVSGRFNTVNGIINTIDRFRIAKYDHSTHRYTDCGTHSVSVDQYLRGDYKCSNWGNPVAEIYLEALRYFSGAQVATTTFDTANDDDYVTGLTRESNWIDPLNSTNACASCAIIMLASGMNSFDRDQLASAADVEGLSGTADVQALTDRVGNIEMGGSFSGEYIANNGNGNCVAQTVTQLSGIDGVCPEVPMLKGGYDSAGLAYYSRIADLRNALPDQQNITTYAMQMNETLPSFEFQVDGGMISILPACESNKVSSDLGDSNWQGCSLTNVEIVDGSTSTQGTLRFYWEDSLWGNDYDIDGVQTIDYCVGATCGSNQVRANEVRFTNGLIYAFAGNSMRFTYAVSGSTRDGLNTGNSNGNWLLRPGGQNFSAFPGEEVNLGNQPSPIDTVFTAGRTTAVLLKSPLWYTAKYGGFNDLDGDNTPNHSSGDNREWDAKNNLTGEFVPDGEPDNYFFASNPARLKSQLSEVFDSIISRTSSGTNAAVVSSSNTGVGAIYQALYQPRVNKGNQAVTWAGYMHSLFIDGRGRIREDSNGNKRLDSSDYAINIYFDASVDRTLLQRYVVNTDQTLSPTGSPRDISELKPIWDARLELAKMSNGNAATQRGYNAANTLRHLLTSLDTDGDGADELVDFTASTMSSFYEYLAVPSASEATQLVNYIRGDDSNPNFRSRTIVMDSSGTAKVWRLGDVIHSTPEIVGPPEGNYNITRQDPTFTEYWNTYKDRRQMIYVGANDGMLHAFNGGFWNSNTQGFDKVRTSETAHELGAEVWGYVPKQVLPHLRWLAERNYPHVYYVDGEPISFDANIFTPSTTHPNGWGTILVVGMRFGGGAQSVTVGGTSEVLSSGYLVFDVTDPESPPTLLAEITHPELGYTTSKPTLVKARVPAVDALNAPDWSQPPVLNKWYLALGSGPTDLASAASNQTGKLFLFDLATGQFASGLTAVGVASAAGDSALGSSYLGDLTAVDWNDDNIDDVVYFGTSNVDLSGGNSVSGNLKRWVLSWDSNGVTTGSGISTLLETGQPIVAEPYTLVDTLKRNWIYAGTGRLLVTSDNRNIEQQSYYGVKEPLDATTGVRTYASVPMSEISDNSSIAVFTDSSIKDISSGSLQDVVINGSTLTNMASLIREMNNWSGWKRNLEHNNSLPSGRNLSASERLFETLYFTEYVPPAEQCDIEGNSYINALDYRTGTASLMQGFGNSTEYVSNTNNVIVDRLDIGTGLASAPLIHRGGDGTTSIITQKSTGEIGTDLVNVTSRGGRASWRQIF
ncbi:pilus assembly protein [Aestuariirhabdus litorea]|nr:PilC/PilY family type IV pilus protein [Aestuariirhabdus litorea]